MSLIINEEVDDDAIINFYMFEKNYSVHGKGNRCILTKIKRKYNKIKKWKKVLWTIRNVDEDGDIAHVRLEYFIVNIAMSVKVEVNDIKLLEKEYRDYRCLKKFDFTKEYTFYEYRRWLGSYMDMCHNTAYCSGVTLTMKPKTQSVLLDMKNIILGVDFLYENGVVIFKTESVKKYTV